MEYLFNYIAYLEKYFNLLLETEEAAELMKQEITTEYIQWDRCNNLRKECVKIYTGLFKTFDQDLIELGNVVTVELYKRDTEGQGLLYAQLFDIINKLVDKFINVNKQGGFSTESIGTKFHKLNIETPDGGKEEKMFECDFFSIELLAGDLKNKLNQIQILINERFKYLKSNKNKNGRLSPQSLKEIFINDTAYTECIDALRNVKAPIISNDNRYLLGSKQKGAFTAWFEIIKSRQKLKEQITSRSMARLLNKEIIGLYLGEDGSTLNRDTTTMYKKYKIQLSKLIE